MAYFKTFLMTSRITDDFWALEIRFALAKPLRDPKVIYRFKEIYELGY